ncbi:MAG: helix-turn-helix domain-containing protein [Dokdonia sp.]|jgi:excisionase family DNA binding protein
MSSNIEIQRICQYCNTEFTARTTRTKYCSHKCNSRDYKAKQRNKKIEKLNDSTAQIKRQPLDELKNKEFLSINEVAQFIGISRRTVYRLIEKGNLTKLKIGSRTLIKRETLNQFFNIQETKPEQMTFDIADGYTITEAMEKYNISQSGLRLLLNRQNVPKIKKGKYTYVPKSVLDKFLT